MWFLPSISGFDNANSFFLLRSRNVTHFGNRFLHCSQISLVWTRNSFVFCFKCQYFLNMTCPMPFAKFGIKSEWTKMKLFFAVNFFPIYSWSQNFLLDHLVCWCSSLVARVNVKVIKIFRLEWNKFWTSFKVDLYYLIGIK